MRKETPCLLIALAFAAASAPALADDCATVKSAMLKTGHTPHTVTITKTDAQGKKTVTHAVQTVDNKYVQLPNGQWWATNIAMKDLDDDLSAVLTCRRSGSDMIGGESTAVYDVHGNQQGEFGDQKCWVSSKNLILKSEGITQGSHYTEEYDFAHATAPANAVSMGGK